MAKLLVLFCIRLFFNLEGRKKTITNRKFKKFGFWSQRIMYLGIYFIICLFNTKKNPQKPKIKNLCWRDGKQAQRQMWRHIQGGELQNSTDGGAGAWRSHTEICKCYFSVVSVQLYSHLVESEHFHALVLSQEWSFLKLNKMCPVTFWLHNYVTFLYR